MNKNLRQAISFSLLLVCLLYAFSFLLDYGVKHSTDAQIGKVNLIMNHQLDKEIIIFGSSVGEASIDAPVINKITGLSTYNAAIDGTRFMQYSGLIKEYNNASNKCKYVIMAETFFTFEKINALTSIERYLAFINKPNIYLPLYQMQPDLVWKCRYVPFYKFIPITDGYYKSSFKGWRNILRNKKPIDDLAGFVPHYQKWQPDQDSLNLAAPIINISIDSGIVKQYGEMLKELNEKGRKVIIVIPPIQNNAWRLLSGLDKLRSTLKSFESNDVLFLDYSNSEMAFNKNYFYNNLHLNNSGAEAFSIMMANKLNEIIQYN